LHCDEESPSVSPEMILSSKADTRGKIIFIQCFDLRLMIIIKVFLGVDELVAKPLRSIFITHPNRVPKINNSLATLESNIN